MKRREWTAKQKLQIVLDRLKNQVSVSDLCSKYPITQGQYYKWRYQLLNNGEKAFESNPDKALVETMSLPTQAVHATIPTCDTPSTLSIS